ncbi:hypothetical protein V5O48_010374, partial [Marasmius crinis-equi]
MILQTTPRAASLSRPRHQPPAAPLNVGAAPGTSPREMFLNNFLRAGVEEKKALDGEEMTMSQSSAFETKSLAKNVDAPPIT